MHELLSGRLPERTEVIIRMVMIMRRQLWRHTIDEAPTLAQPAPGRLLGPIDQFPRMTEIVRGNRLRTGRRHHLDIAGTARVTDGVDKLLSDQQIKSVEGRAKRRT